jgi:hypothetical protein
LVSIFSIFIAQLAKSNQAYLKKLIAILLLIVLLFNIVGYKFVANYFEHKATDDMQTSLDLHHYKESDLISFKLHLNLPYISSSTEFESVEGNIDINGINYQYVKKRFFNDTLEILCVPNFTKSSIKESKNDFAKQLNDIASSNNSKKSSSNQIVKASISDFIQEHHFDIYQHIYTSNLKHDYYHSISSSYDFLQGLDQPPEA